MERLSEGKKNKQEESGMFKISFIQFSLLQTLLFVIYSNVKVCERRIVLVCLY